MSRHPLAQSRRVCSAYLFCERDPAFFIALGPGVGEGPSAIPNLPPPSFHQPTHSPLPPENRGECRPRGGPRCRSTPRNGPLQTLEILSESPYDSSPLKFTNSAFPRCAQSRDSAPMPASVCSLHRIYPGISLCFCEGLLAVLGKAAGRSAPCRAPRTRSSGMFLWVFRRWAEPDVHDTGTGGGGGLDPGGERKLYVNVSGAHEENRLCGLQSSSQRRGTTRTVL